MVLAAIVLVLGIAAAGPVRNYLAQRAEIDRLEQQISELRVERARLERQIERIREPEYLEQLARQCLGMVRPGEIAFTNPDGPRADIC